MDMLKEILLNQKELSLKLTNLENNQTIIFYKTNNLVEEEVAISNNHGVLSEQLQKLELNCVDKAEMLAVNNLIRQCKVTTRKNERSVCLMTGETRDSALDEVASLLPLQSHESVMDVEEKLKKTEFAQAMTPYFHTLKGTSEDVDSVLRITMTDDLLESFNWDGRVKKQALGKLKLVDTI